MKKELIKRIEALPAKNGKDRPFVDKKIVIGLIQTMDEPKQPTLDNIIHQIKFMEEDLKQEWLSKILKELGSDFELKKFQEGFKSGSWIGRQLINADKIRQKLNKPVIPQFVADWIEEARKSCKDVADLFDFDFTNEEVGKWFMQERPFDLVARACLDGYEVEKEKRYLVKVNAENCSTKYLVFGEITGLWFFAHDKYGNVIIKHTRKELEEAGFGWVFDCPGIEVEEVKE